MSLCCWTWTLIFLICTSHAFWTCHGGVCVQQGTGSALLRQTSAVHQSTTSLKNNCGRKVNGLYLCIFMTTAYRLYLINIHVTLQNPLAQSLLVFLVKAFWDTEPDALQELTMFSTYINLFFPTFLQLAFDSKIWIHASVPYQLFISICVCRFAITDSFHECCLIVLCLEW